MNRLFFDENLERRGTHSVKWEEKEETFPLWVADMDFTCAPAITQAVQKRAAHGIYGYTLIPDEWADTMTGWMERRHGLKLDPKKLTFTSGVIPALSSVVRRVTHPAEKVLLLSPVYNIFYNSILNNGRVPLESQIRNVNGKWEIDFKDLEEKMKDPQTSMMILCNPQNPLGRIWTEEELEKIADLSRKYNVTVFSDEVHADLIRSGEKFISYGSVNPDPQKTILALSPSKTFNMAGLQSAGIYVEDDTLRHRISRGLNNDEVAEPNAFAIDASIAAYRDGEAWLESLKEYLDENVDMIIRVLNERLPELKIIRPQATYLLWVDCSAVTDCTDELTDFLDQEYGVHLSNGSAFGKGGESGFRLNFATSRKNLEKAVEVLITGVQDYQKKKKKSK